MLDHPILTGCLTELLSEPSFTADAALSHPFRCESSLITIRPPGWTVGEFSPGFNRPHVVRPVAHAQPMKYQVDGGKIFGGLTTVIVELNDVQKRQGGTAFLSGSHKAHFSYSGEGPKQWAPNATQGGFEDSIMRGMEHYDCPAGSAVIFTESTLHMATDWHGKSDRVAMFSRYNSVWAQWIYSNSPAARAVYAEMPRRRRSLFRDVYAHDFSRGKRNLFYDKEDEDNLVR